MDTENGARKAEIANLKNFAESENDSRKTEIANLDNFAKSENDGRKSDIADLNARFVFHPGEHDKLILILFIQVGQGEL